METRTWERVEGMIIAAQLDPEELVRDLEERGVVVQLDWFKETPNMVGVRMLTDGEHVGVLPAGKTEVQEGPKLSGLVESLAERFSAEVMVGDIGVDRLELDDLDLPELPEEDRDLLVVEISDTPASAVPLMAAFNGVDIVDFELENGRRALVAQLPVGRSNWTLGDVPLVTLTAAGDQFQAFLIEDEDPEGIITYNWGMEERIVAGSAGEDPAARALATSLVGPLEEVAQIHDAVPGISVELAKSAALQRGDLAIGSFTRSLGLPPAVADFLSGKLSLDTIGGTLHQARGVSNAIGRSVDIMIQENRGEKTFWDVYTEAAVEKPWIFPVVAAAEATVGLSLLAATRGRGEKRTGAKKLGMVVGAAFLIDSVAELSLAKAVRLRHQRKEAETL